VVRPRENHQAVFEVKIGLVGIRFHPVFLISVRLYRISLILVFHLHFLEFENKALVRKLNPMGVHKINNKRIKAMKIYPHTADQFFNKVLFFALVVVVFYLFYKIKTYNKAPAQEVQYHALNYSGE
jgi:hypothetical protein